MTGIPLHWEPKLRQGGGRWALRSGRVGRRRGMAKSYPDPLPFAPPPLIVNGFTKSIYSMFRRRSGKMRITSMLAGLTLVLAACGGGKKTEDQGTTAAPEQQSAPA